MDFIYTRLDFIKMWNERFSLYCVLFICTKFVFVEPNMFANQIESCNSVKMSEGVMAPQMQGLQFETNNLYNDNNYDVIKEEVLLFDWDELLRDIHPIIQKCHRGEERSLCGRRWEDEIFD